MKACVHALFRVQQALTSRTSSVWSEVRMLTVTFWPLERQMSRAASSVGICWVSCGNDPKHNRLLFRFMGTLCIFPSIPINQQQKSHNATKDGKNMGWSELRWIAGGDNTNIQLPLHCYTLHIAVNNPLIQGQIKPLTSEPMGLTNVAQ